MILFVGAESETTELRESLRGEDSSLLTATSRREALNLARRHPVETAVVSLEESLSEALDTLQGLLDLREDISILLITNSQHKQAVLPLLQAGLATHIPKPLTFLDLRSKLQQIQSDQSITSSDEKSLSPLPDLESSPRVDPVTIDHLIITLAHRLKNPLVAIRTFTHLLQDRFNDAQFRKDFYQIVQQEVETLDSLVDQLVEFSELPDPSFRPFPILALVRESIRQAMIRLKGRRIDLESHLSDDNLSIQVDRDQFIYALTHLLVGLTSPTKRTSHAGISVYVQETDQSGEVEILLCRKGSPSQDGGQVFGLELFIAKRIIERQQGDVQFDLSSSEQTSVSILLPQRISNSRSSKGVAASWGYFTPTYTERRKGELSITFKNRRAKQRRRYQRSSYFPERRKIISTPTQS